VTDAILRFDRVVKNYSGLRPLRVAELAVHRGERVAISGLDAAAAELFVNLVTGATLPDEGTVETFGRSTAEIADGDEWLASLAGFGIVSPRAVLLEAASLQQNLAMPFTLQIDPVPAEIAARVASLAEECGLDAASLGNPASDLPASGRARVHLARAIALDPRLLLLEHPTAGLQPGEGTAFARDAIRTADRRGLAALAITADEEFAAVFAHRPLALVAATGALRSWQKKRGWFR
jgi:ABC-type transporter Mla maintaining outer membrane lipid asymmetry ATPase subunit MlaF